MGRSPSSVDALAAITLLIVVAALFYYLGDFMYRLLDVGETIRESDEYFGSAIWHDCTSVAGKIVEKNFKPVRRKIEMARISEPELVKSEEFGFLYYKNSNEVVEGFKKVYEEQHSKK